MGQKTHCGVSGRNLGEIEILLKGDYGGLRAALWDIGASWGGSDASEGKTRLARVFLGWLSP